MESFLLYYRQKTILERYEWWHFVSEHMHMLDNNYKFLYEKNTSNKNKTKKKLPMDLSWHEKIIAYCDTRADKQICSYKLPKISVLEIHLSRHYCTLFVYWGKYLFPLLHIGPERKLQKHHSSSFSRELWFCWRQNTLKWVLHRQGLTEMFFAWYHSWMFWRLIQDYALNTKYFSSATVPKLYSWKRYRSINIQYW